MQAGRDGLIIDLTSNERSCNAVSDGKPAVHNKRLTSETGDDFIPCEVCGLAGNDVLVCFKCERGHHPTCLEPSRFPTPAGQWDCPMCDTACEVCRSTNDSCNMLPCSGYPCNRRCHCHCLKAPFLTLPAKHEQWFCPQCEARRASKGKGPEAFSYKGADDFQAHASNSPVSFPAFRQPTLTSKHIPGALLPVGSTTYSATVLCIKICLSK